MILIVLLKSLNKERLKGFVFVLFNKNFITTEADDNPFFFNGFNLLLFLFSTITLSLIISFLLDTKSYLFDTTFSSFLIVFTIVLSYFLLKKFLEFLLVRLFLIQKQLLFYTISKTSYLYTISFVLFIVYILTVYSALKASVLLYSTFFLLVIRFIAHIVINKKLIFSKLFYFILYICALEIAPLFLLFKLIL